VEAVGIAIFFLTTGSLMSDDQTNENAESHPAKKWYDHKPTALTKAIAAIIVYSLFIFFDIHELWPWSKIAAIIVGVIVSVALLYYEAFAAEAINFPTFVIASVAITFGGIAVYFFVPMSPPSPTPTPTVQRTAPPAPMPTPTVGWLQPANEPTPENGCSRHGNDSPVVIMGDNGVMLGDVRKATALKVGNCPLVGLQITDNGASIDATIYDAGGRKIGEIENNRFSIPPADGLVIEKSGDLSTLVVHDGANQEVLYARYLNKNAFRIRGIFSCPLPRSHTVRVTDKAISDFPFRMSCVQWSGTGEAKAAAFSIQ
jgi:hypothetical protein